MAIFPAELWPDILKHLVPTNCIYLSGYDRRLRWRCIHKDHPGHQSIQFAIDLMTLSRNISLDCKRILYGCNTFRSRSNESTFRLLRMLGIYNTLRLRHFEIAYADRNVPLHDFNLENGYQSHTSLLEDLAKSGYLESLETFTVTSIGRGIYWRLDDSQDHPFHDDPPGPRDRFDTSRWYHHYIAILRNLINNNPSLEGAKIYVNLGELRTTLVRRDSKMYDSYDLDIEIDLDAEEEKSRKQKIPPYMRVLPPP